MTSATSADTLDSDELAEPAEPVVDDPAPTSRRRPVRLGILATLAALFVAVSIGAGAEGWLLIAAHQRDVASRQALAAAQHFAEAFTNADPGTIDQRIDEVTNATTGEFHAKYVKNISQLRAMLIDNKVTTHGSVVDSAVKSAGTDTVEVLLLVKQSFTSAATPEAPADPPAEVIAMAITVQKIDGHWLVAKVVPGEKL